MSNFTQIRPVGAELFHADRQTDRQKTFRHDEANTFFFRNFANTPNKAT